ncbi:MAG: type II 3-dehydroquinate dehydratase [Ilumatobacteraceae bacterium]
MPTILLIHGPNLNLLGQREPEIYGQATLGDYVDRVRDVAAPLGLSVEQVQSNHEGDLVDAIHEARGSHAAIIVNAGALTHYSWSLHDALATFDGPIVEVHISQPNAREPWRHTSVVAPVASGSIAGFGMLGYELAVGAVARLLESRS